MSLTSIDTYAWLFGAVAIFYRLPARLRVIYLVLISCCFYLTYSVQYFFLLMSSVALVYAIGRKLGNTVDPAARKGLFMLGFIPVLGSLILFKVFLVTTNILFPVGLSYYSFKLISYLIEVYRDPAQAENDVPRFTAFATFGAQMISGPIQRHYEFLPQLRERRFLAFDTDFINSGVQLILGGLLLKLIVGNCLGAFVAAVDADPARFNWSVIATSTLCYTLYLFADFAGYTLVAIGIGRLFGISSPPNFNAPFSASNMQDFWRRWHMSLTRWLGDYIFKPLWLSIDPILTRFNLEGKFLLDLGLVVSIMINMSLIGVWHGFTWSFLIFGVFHGVMLSASTLTKKKVDRYLKKRNVLRRLNAFVGVISTFLIMTFSQIFFQAKDVPSALEHLRLLSGVQRPGVASFRDLPADVYSPVAICMLVSFYVGYGMPGIQIMARGWNRYVPPWLSLAIGMLLLSMFVKDSGSRFIYGQF